MSLALRFRHGCGREGGAASRRLTWLAQCQREIMRRVMGRMLRGKLGAAFNGWRESQAELARQQGVLGKALARMKQGMMGRCWLTLKDAADEAKVSCQC